MKNSLLYALLMVFMLSSCGTKNENVAQLQKLKKQRDELNDKIVKLEAKIAKDGSKKNEDLHLVKILNIEKAEFNHYIQVQGRVDGDQNVAAMAQAIGIVTKIYTTEGAQVKAGQVLAQLDDQVLQTTLTEIQASYEFANNVYLKQKKLWDQKIGSEIQYLTAKNNKESLENRIKTLKNQMEMYKIKSPINGSVEEILLKVGQAVSPGFPMIRVVNFSHIKVIADVSESFSSLIKKGDEVVVSFPDFNYETKGKVNFTSKYINTINRTFQVEVRLVPKDIELRANMVAVMKINDYKAKDAISIPVSYILSDTKGSFVFVSRKSGKKYIADKKYVTTGQSYNGITEIKEGLSDGEQLITIGYQGLTGGEMLKF